MNTVKALQDMILDVRVIPFGSPENRDREGQYFTKNTNLYLEHLKAPLVDYYHGFSDDLIPLGVPDIIGEPLNYTIKEDGVWWRIALDKTNKFAQKVWEAAKKGMAVASSGSMTHRVKFGKDGEILEWPLTEISLFEIDTGKSPANRFAWALPVVKSLYEKAGKDLPNLTELDSTGKVNTKEDNKLGAIKMEAKDVKKIVSDVLVEHEDAKATKSELVAKVKKEEEERTAVAVKAAEDKINADWAAKTRLPGGGGSPRVMKYHDLAKYEHLDASSLALGMSIVKQAKNPVSKEAYQALALKTFDEREVPTDRDGNIAVKLNRAQFMIDVGLPAAIKFDGKAIKTDEIMQQDLTSYGDEWVWGSWSNELWRNIRIANRILAMIPQQEARGESNTIPVESSDPVWYTVPEVADLNVTTGRPDATVPDSQVGTAKKEITLKKLGARVLHSGELAEDSIIPVASQIKDQLQVSGAEILEALLIDGDTEAGASANINDIAGTPAATDWFMAMDGFRKLALVTNTDNSRPGGVLEAVDFIETLKLMGAAGINALDVMKTFFLVDANVYWKSLQLEEVKTRDVFVAPTIEKGVLTGLWGRKLFASAQFHRASAVRKAQAADGKIDLDTLGDNVSGSLLAVRADQWKFGWKRRMTLKTSEYPEADAYQIVAMIRIGMAYRDSEAAAITYGITV